MRASVTEVGCQIFGGNLNPCHCANAVDLGEEAIAQLADPAPSAETVIYDRQRLKLVELALGELPERTRIAFGGCRTS